MSSLTTEPTFVRLLVHSIPDVAASVGHHLVVFAAEVLGLLGVKHPLAQQRGQFLEQAVLANQVLGRLECHCVSGQADLRRRWIVKLPLRSGVLGLVENIDKESRDDSKAGACAVHAGVQEVRHKAGLTARRVP